MISSIFSIIALKCTYNLAKYPITLYFFYLFLSCKVDFHYGRSILTSGYSLPKVFRQVQCTSTYFCLEELNFFVLFSTFFNLYSYITHSSWIFVTFRSNNSKKLKMIKSFCHMEWWWLDIFCKKELFHIFYQYIYVSACLYENKYIMFLIEVPPYSFYTLNKQISLYVPWKFS